MWINMYGHIHSSTFPNTPASFHPNVTTPTNPSCHINIYITTSTHPQGHALTFRLRNSRITLGTLTSTTGGAFVISKIRLLYGRVHLHNIHYRRHFGFLNVMIILLVYSPPEAFWLSSTLWLLCGALPHTAPWWHRYYDYVISCASDVFILSTFVYMRILISYKIVALTSAGIPWTISWHLYPLCTFHSSMALYAC